MSGREGLGSPGTDARGAAAGAAGGSGEGRRTAGGGVCEQDVCCASVGSAASGESRAGDAGESGRDHDFDRDAAAALGAVIGDFGRRLSLLSDRQNSMMQSAGMLLAFASILLIETVRLIFEGAGDALAIAALLCFLSSCAICVWTIWGWKNWELNMGADPDDILDIFNEWKWIDLQHSLLYGAVMSSRIMADKNYILRRMIAYMIAPLLAGVALIMADVARHLI